MEQNQRPDHELTPQQSTPDEQRTPPASTPSKRFSQFFKHTPRITSATALLLIALALVFYLIGNLTAFSTFFGKIMGLFKPLLWGALIAYFCNPILRFWERRVLFKVSSFHIRRMLGIILTYFSIILAVSVFGLILLPSLISSFKELLSNFQNYIANAVQNYRWAECKFVEVFLFRYARKHQHGIHFGFNARDDIRVHSVTDDNGILAAASKLFERVAHHQGIWLADIVCLFACGQLNWCDERAAGRNYPVLRGVGKVTVGADKLCAVHNESRCLLYLLVVKRLA